MLRRREFRLGLHSAVAGLARILTEHRIVNVHEHIQGRENVPELLQFMDSHGMGKTILLGSSWFTISLYEKAGFTRYDDNNAALMEIVRAYPGRFEAWPTFNPTDPEALSKIAALVEQGASGVKLYLGHGYRSRYRNQYLLHPMAMDDPRMDSIYAYLSREGIPVCFHVNPAMPGFAEEFIAVLTEYPNLKVNAPHFLPFRRRAHGWKNSCASFRTSTWTSVLATMTFSRTGCAAYRAGPTGCGASSRPIPIGSCLARTS